MNEPINRDKTKADGGKGVCAQIAHGRSRVRGERGADAALIHTYIYQVGVKEELHPVRSKYATQAQEEATTRMPFRRVFSVISSHL